MLQFESVIVISTMTLATVIDCFAAIIIAHGTVKATFQYVKSIGSNLVDKRKLRLTLGKSLAIALEFLLAADILRTAVAPGWDEIGKLGAIAALRTMLNYFLERELKNEEVNRTL
jgi:uncharacterized membrane protein